MIKIKRYGYTVGLQRVLNMVWRLYRRCVINANPGYSLVENERGLDKDDDKEINNMYIMKNVNNVLCIILLLLLTGCNKAGLEKKIRNKIEACDSDKCRIIIAQLTNFKWDRMIVFNHYLSPEKIDAAIGMDYPYWENNTRPMIFLYKNKIIYYENNEDNFEHIMNDQVIFDYPDSLNYQTFTPQTATFTSKKVEMSYGEHYFELSR